MEPSLGVTFQRTDAGAHHRRRPCGKPPFVDESGTEVLMDVEHHRNRCHPRDQDQLRVVDQYQIVIGGPQSDDVTRCSEGLASLPPDCPGQIDRLDTRKRLGASGGPWCCQRHIVTRVEEGTYLTGVDPSIARPVNHRDDENPHELRFVDTGQSPFWV